MLKKDGFPAALYRIYSECRLPRAAAALAYSLTLSVFPMLLCLGAVLRESFSSAQSIFSYLSGMLPQAEAELLAAYLRFPGESGGRALFSAGAATLLTSSSAAFRVLENAEADIYGVKMLRSPRAVILSFAYSALFFAGIYLSCAVLLVGESLSERAFSGALSRFWTLMKYPAVFSLMYFMILGTYKITSPPERRHVRRKTGAFFSSAAFSAVSVFFSAGIGRSMRYERVYGSIASVIILMTWFYTCSLILLMGSAVNAAIYEKMIKNS